MNCILSVLYLILLSNNYTRDGDMMKWCVQYFPLTCWEIQTNGTKWAYSTEAVNMTKYTVYYIYTYLCFYINVTGTSFIFVFCKNKNDKIIVMVAFISLNKTILFIQHILKQETLTKVMYR